jgi:mannosyltransferase
MLVGYGLLAAAGIAVNIYTVFLVAAHGIALLLLGAGWHRLRQWLAAALGACVAASPVILLAIGERAQLGDREPLDFLGWLAGVSGKQFFIGDTAGNAPTFVARWLWTGSAVTLAILAWGLVAFAILRARRSGLPERSMALVWVLAWVAVPPTIVLAFTLVGTNIYHPRYFSFTAPAFAIAVAVGVAELPRDWVRRLALALLAAATVPVFLSQRDIYAKNGYDWSEVSLQVSSIARPGDGVYFAPTPPTRTIEIAYPAAFARLSDLTLLTTPAADASLDGSSLPLEGKLLATAPNRVIAIWSVRSESKSADQALFAGAGYREVSDWTGPETELAEFER